MTYETQRVDLRQPEEYDLKLINIALRLGNATLKLSAWRGERWGVSVSEDISANTFGFQATGISPGYSEAVPTETFFDRGVLLPLGWSMNVSRRNGVEILLPNGQIFDKSRPSGIKPDSEYQFDYEWDAFEDGIRADDSAPRGRVEIFSTGLCQVGIAHVRPLIDRITGRHTPEPWLELIRLRGYGDEADTDPRLSL
jgi:hypothetical protein